MSEDVPEGLDEKLRNAVSGYLTQTGDTAGAIAALESVRDSVANLDDVGL
ncbi:hypothetical protein [Halomarina oriensis]|uniref:Uncharacterized protein n=1 Tax=Halomarina oriensis TaxID=671145 RepID=A0A6B0GS20_9EURY|nr:hypothetical protein [Halomarina oriensis]MWG36469.1 hypothetical protein [Halomarina oriensis]